MKIILLQTNFKNPTPTLPSFPAHYRWNSPNRQHVILAVNHVFALPARDTEKAEISTAFKDINSLLSRTGSQGALLFGLKGNGWRSAHTFFIWFSLQQPQSWGDSQSAPDLHTAEGRCERRVTEESSWSCRWRSAQLAWFEIKLMQHNNMRHPECRYTRVHNHPECRYTQVHNRQSLLKVFQLLEGNSGSLGSAHWNESVALLAPKWLFRFFVVACIIFRPNDMMLKWTTNVHDINNTKCALFMYPQDNYVVAPVTCCTSPGETGRSKPCVFIGSLLLWRRCRTSGAGTLGDD